MATTKIRGDSQIMDLTIDLGRLQVPFLTQTGGNWDITNGNPDYVNGATITGVPDPVNAQDVATKNYVDALLAGVAWKDPVRAATTASVDISTELEDGDTIDGVTLAEGDRVLVKDQANAANDEVQTAQITGSPTGGTFTMTLYPSGGDPITTAALAYNITAAALETAIDAAFTAAAYPGWTNGDITVTGTDILTGDLTLTYNDGSAGSGSLAASDVGELTMDISGLTGGTPATSIATTQEGNALGSENGVYIVQASGAALRADDWADGVSAANYAVFVSEGNSNADDAYVVTNDAPNDIIGSDGLTFVQFAGSGTYPTDVFGDCVSGSHGSPTVTLSNTNIVSGTERIYLNGLRQRRGAGDDYTIVYATGVITFNFNLKNTPGQTDLVCADYQL